VSLLDQLADQLETPVELDERPRWRDLARPEQLPPPGEWLTWLYLAGRGSGKTRACGEAIAEDARRYPGLRGALVAPTFSDARDTMVEGDSGLLRIFRDGELRGGSRETAWNRSIGELFLANGSYLKIFSSERPGRLRGPQFHVAWGDELAQWLDASKGTAEDTTWSNLLFALRLRPEPDWPAGFASRIYASTTPRPVPLLRVRPGIAVRDPHKAGILQKPTTVTSRGRSLDNVANLADEYRRNVIDPLVGTRLGRQELEAELLEDVEGALITSAGLDRGRRVIGEMPHLLSRVVAVDPAASAGEKSDETGIVVVGADAMGDGWVLDDRSGRMSPDGWGRAVWEAAIEHDASAIVVEDNQGGDMVEHVLATTWQVIQAERLRRGLLTPTPPIVRVHPTSGQGKWVRASALQPMLEQGRIHMLGDPLRPGVLDALEDQLTSWTGDKAEDSPDRVDGLVHGLTWLLFPMQRSATMRGRYISKIPGYTLNRRR
jgi:phage terminase large subunit-like protein